MILLAFGSFSFTFELVGRDENIFVANFFKRCWIVNEVRTAVISRSGYSHNISTLNLQQPSLINTPGRENKSFFFFFKKRKAKKRVVSFDT